MTQSVPSTYAASNAAVERTPVYVLEIAGISAKYSTHKIFDYASECAVDSPVLALRLGEAVTSPVTTTAVDSSGNGLDGTYNNTPTLGVTGALFGDSNTAVNLNGSNESITVPDDDLLDLGVDIFTLEAWVRDTTGTSQGAIFDKGTDGYVLQVSAGTVHLLKSGAGSSIAFSSSALPLNVWTHVVAAKSGSSRKIYFNGVDVTTNGTNQTIVATASDLTIGNFSGNFFQGDIDELRLYATALSTARIKAHYEAGLGLYYRTNVNPYIRNISGIGSQVDPIRCKTSVGSIVVDLLDKFEDVTNLVSTSGGVGNKQAVIKAGFANIAYGDFVQVHAGPIENWNLSADKMGYELKISDATAFQNRQVFFAARTSLRTAAGSGDTRLDADNLAFFTLRYDYDLGHDTGYARIDNEIVRFDELVSGALQPDDNGYYRIAYGNGVFVAVGQNKTIATSIDARDWTMQTGPAGHASNCVYRDVCYASGIGSGAGRWVIVGTGICATSDDDGVTWVAQTMPSGTAVYQAIAFSPGLTIFAVGSTDTNWASSVDGATWTARTGSNRGADKMIWSAWKGLFITVASAGSGFSDRGASSTNGTSWTNRTISDDSWRSLASDEATIIVAISATGNIYKSTNGTTWASQTSFSTVEFQDVCWSAQFAKFIAVSRNYREYYSADGLTWTDVIGPEYLGFNGVAAGDSTLPFAVTISRDTSNLNPAMYTADGILWLNFMHFVSTTRGVLGSTAAAHAAGAPINEIIRLKGHPIDIVSGVLTGTDKAGLSIASSLIDTAALAALKASIGSAYLMDFLITGSTNAKNWIEDEICAPLGLLPVIGGDGSISFKETELPGTADDSITDDDILLVNGVPQIEYDSNFRPSLINKIIYQYDYDLLAGSYLTTTNPVKSDSSITAFGESPLIISSKGLHTDSSIAVPNRAIDLINTIANNILVRYASGGVALVKMRCFLSKHLIENGDIIEVTSSILPDKDTGTRGVTAEPMEVISRQINFLGGYVEFTMLWTGWNT